MFSVETKNQQHSANQYKKHFKRAKMQKIKLIKCSLSLIKALSSEMSSIETGRCPEADKTPTQTHHLYGTLCISKNCQTSVMHFKLEKTFCTSTKACQCL